MGKLQAALQWLLTNNALYKDVRVYFPTMIDISMRTQIADECKDCSTTRAHPNPEEAHEYLVATELSPNIETTIKELISVFVMS